MSIKMEYYILYSLKIQTSEKDEPQSQFSQLNHLNHLLFFI